MNLSIDELVCIAQSRPSKTSKKRQRHHLLEKTSTSEPIAYPYKVTDDDHCETPAQAYVDISSILISFALLIGKTAETLMVYDPYFCEGSVIERMGSIGFKTVHNVKEDFYLAHAENRLPQYDVLVTNPPYSGTNMERLLRICVDSGKPWLLLMPNYVYTKDYYAEVVRPCSAPVFYVVPNRGRYLYTTPKVGGCSLTTLRTDDRYQHILSHRAADRRRAPSTRRRSQRFGTAIWGATRRKCCCTAEPQVVPTSPLQQGWLWPSLRETSPWRWVAELRPQPTENTDAV